MSEFLDMGLICEAIVNPSQGEWAKIRKNETIYFIKKIDSTHIKLIADVMNVGIETLLSQGAESKAAVYHIGQLQDKPELYKALVEWLNSREDINGKVFP